LTSILPDSVSTPILAAYCELSIIGRSKCDAYYKAHPDQQNPVTKVGNTFKAAGVNIAARVEGWFGK
jgi:hypothetical protein